MRLITQLAWMSMVCLHATIASATVFEDFEAIIPNTTPGVPFTVGAAPESAEFSGDAFAGVAGIGELYFSGIRAWMVNPGGTGTITFLENASYVEFWTRLRTGANGPSIFTSFDDQGDVIESITLATPTSFQLLRFEGNIDRLEIVNGATEMDQMNSIDDLTFATVVPEPGSMSLFGGALCAVAIFCRRRMRRL
jgi:hypothetical protein